MTRLVDRAAQLLANAIYVADQAVQRRGHTAVRLPWIKKEATP